ncbi:hypothetical protein B0H14DRAFT_3487071 [Mycena olivaceomarginata]|nr:hypothetical protein B0H14DRAFT_3487071 [Mycena olivaceomarginata]
MHRPIIPRARINRRVPPRFETAADPSAYEPYHCARFARPCAPPASTPPRPSRVVRSCLVPPVPSRPIPPTLAAFRGAPLRERPVPSPRRRHTCFPTPNPRPRIPCARLFHSTSTPPSHPSHPIAQLHALLLFAATPVLSCLHFRLLRAPISVSRAICPHPHTAPFPVTLQLQASMRSSTSLLIAAFTLPLRSSIPRVHPPHPYSRRLPRRHGCQFCFRSTATLRVSLPRRPAHLMIESRLLSAPATVLTPTTRYPHPSPASLPAHAAAPAPPRLCLASPLSHPRTSDEHLGNPIPRMPRPLDTVSLQARFRIEYNAAPSVLSPRCAVITVYLPPLFRLLRLDPPRNYSGQSDLPRSCSPYRIPRRPPPRPPISIAQFDPGISGFLSLLVMEAPCLEYPMTPSRGLGTRLAAESRLRPPASTSRHLRRPVSRTRLPVLVYASRPQAHRAPSASPPPLPHPSLSSLSTVLRFYLLTLSNCLRPVPIPV